MKTYQFSTKITPDGKLELPPDIKSLSLKSEVKVILLVEEQEIIDWEETGFKAESFAQSWQEAITGNTIPLSELWEDNDLE
jgi:hypothetical protein